MKKQRKTKAFGGNADPVKSLCCGKLLENLLNIVIIRNIEKRRSIVPPNKGEGALHHKKECLYE